MKEEIIKRNNIKIIGEGEETLFFIHGYGCDQNMWRFITPEFIKDYKIVLIDLVGAGNSDEGAYDYNKYNQLKGYADDIVEICDVLNLSNITLIGHSISANIAILASLYQQEFLIM